MKRVLVVDDSKSWVDFHCQNLRDNYGEDIEIDCAYSAQEGYDWVCVYADNPYDLIITDLQMESVPYDRFAGEWLVEQIQLLKQYATTRIIIVSGSSFIKAIAESFSVDYIPKGVAARDTSVYAGLLG